MKHFEEILNSLGAKSVKSLKESRHWTLWQAEYVTPVASIKGNYLYLKASCPQSEASAPNLSDFSALCGQGGYQVVVAPSSDLAKDLVATKQKFRAANALTTQQLLQENLLRSIQYRSLQREDHFISPSVTVSNGTLEPDGLNFLSKWLVGEVSSLKNTPIGLLSADGGIGKTTLARELCETVRAKYPRVLPLLIEADQWKNIANTGFTLDTLWDIAIARRLENGNTLRSNHAALRVLMQEGLLVVIFDGFDELAAISGDTNRPQEIISELQNLFTPEDETPKARVILTSRTTYWTAIESTIATTTNQIEVFKLNGFDNDQRKAYFAARLPDLGSRDLALRLAKQVSGAIYGDNPNLAAIEPQNEDRLSGTPFILSLIAHYVEENDAKDLNPFQIDPLEPLLLGVCRRENIRQDLQIAPEVQLSIFEELFRMTDGEISHANLDFVLQVYEVADENARLRFSNHFLLRRTSPDHLAARFEVLKVYFVARFLAKGLRKLYSTTPQKEIALALSQNFLGQSQVIEWLVWQLKRLPHEAVVAAVHHAFGIIQLPENVSVKHKAAIALFRVVAQLVEGASKSERLESLGVLMNSQQRGSTKIFNNSTFAGRIRSIDLSSSTFNACTFVDAEFSSCLFTSGTSFHACSFEGTLDFSSCDGLSDIQINEAKNSAIAEVVWSKILRVKPSSKVRHEFAEEALTKALKKFKGDFGFHGIQTRRKNSSLNPRNPYNQDIWDSLKKHRIVEEHTISGVSEGGFHIREDKEIRREIAQYLDNGILGSTSLS